MTTDTLKSALAVINERKSVRHFTGEVVAEAAIEQILQAAMAAPAAINKLPWRFIVIKNRDSLNRLADGLPFAQMLKTAGSAIVVCAVPEAAALESEVFAIIDCTCASENILLAAEALHLGAVWTAVYPNTTLMNFVRTALHIPADVIPLNIIPIGHPTGEDMPHDKYDLKNIHRECW